MKNVTLVALALSFALAACSVRELFGNSFHPCSASLLRWNANTEFTSPGAS